MQLIKINSVKAQAAQAALAGGSQVPRLSVLYPFVGTRAVETALGGDYQACGIRIQRLRDNLFTHMRSIGVSGVDEVDSQFHSTPQNANGLGPICGLSPNSGSSDSHRAESQARNTEIASDQEFAGFFSGRLISLHCKFLILHMSSLPGER